MVGLTAYSPIVTHMSSYSSPTTTQSYSFPLTLQLDTIYQVLNQCPYRLLVSLRRTNKDLKACIDSDRCFPSKKISLLQESNSSLTALFCRLVALPEMEKVWSKELHLFFTIWKERDAKAIAHQLVDQIPLWEYACKHGQTELFKELLELDDSVCQITSIKMHAKKTPLLCSAEEGQYNITRILLEHRANPDETNQLLFTPLYFAVTRDRPQEASLLLDFQANPNKIITCFGQSYLHKVSSPSIATLLLKYGANLELRDLTGKTPLAEASTLGKADIARLFLEKGADGNACDHSGFSVLHHAAKRGHDNIVKLLLSHGASAMLENHDHKTAAQLADENQHSNTAHLLDEAMQITLLAKRKEEDGIYTSQSATSSPPHRKKRQLHAPSSE